MEYYILSDRQCVAVDLITAKGKTDALILFAKEQKFSGYEISLSSNGNWELETENDLFFAVETGEFETGDKCKCLTCANRRTLAATQFSPSEEYCSKNPDGFMTPFECKKYMEE